MTFSIITPSFKQLDWLRLCVASVRDQVAACGEIVNSISQSTGSTARRATTGLSISDQQSAISNSQSPCAQSAIDNQQLSIPPLSVEHIIQDAGSPGIEEFAREVGADFYRDGNLIFRGNNAECGMQNAEFPGSRQFPESRAQSPTLPPVILENSVKKPAHSKFQIPNYSLAIYSECDDGMYDAINLGLRKATGEIVAHLNSDEQYLPAALQVIAGLFLAQSNLDLLYASAVILGKDGEYICQRDPLIPNPTHVCISHLHTLTASTFIRRETITQKRLFFSKDFLASGDAEWALRALRAGLRIKAVPFLSSAFFETESNLGLSQVSMAEKDRLKQTLPQWKRLLWPLWILHHLARRVLAGHYLRDPFDYDVYTPQIGATARMKFKVLRATAIYPKYLKSVFGN